MPVLTVRENIVLPIQLDGGRVDENYVGQVVTALGLEKKLDSLPGQLSGGQQQRVAIARAWLRNPLSSWPMSPPATSTAAPARTCCP